MAISPIVCDPALFFRHLHIDESLLLDIHFGASIRMVINLASASFDSIRIPRAREKSSRSTLPTAVFWMLSFEGISNAQLLDNFGKPFELDMPVTRIWGSGPAVIYGFRNTSHDDSHHVKCGSNKFEMLTFDYLYLKFAYRAGTPIGTKGQYQYIDTVTGEQIDPKKPFIETI